MLQVDSIAFGYGVPRGGAPLVLSDVSFSIRRGAIVGLLGPNGSGKTTLLRIIDGMLKPIGGRVTIDGEDVSRMTRRALARRVAIVPQETHAAFDFTALDIVLMGRYAHLGPLQLEGPDDMRIAHDAMTATATTAFASRAFDTLSGGEKQRVVICRRARASLGRAAAR